MRGVSGWFHGGAIMRVTENAEWARKQFESCKLGDKRRTERVCTMAMNMLERPEEFTRSENELDRITP